MALFTVFHCFIDCQNITWSNYFKNSGPTAQFVCSCLSTRNESRDSVHLPSRLCEILKVAESSTWFVLLFNDEFQLHRLYNVVLQDDSVD